MRGKGHVRRLHDKTCPINQEDPPIQDYMLKSGKKVEAVFGRGRPCAWPIVCSVGDLVAFGGSPSTLFA